MRHESWISPRRFQDAPEYPGRLFVQQIRASAEAALRVVALAAWKRSVYCNINMAEESINLLEEVDMGKRNVVFRLAMGSEAVWVARLKIPGLQKSRVADAAIRADNERLAFLSEVTTMQLVRNTTNIPVPAVYDYSADAENRLQTPYILMENLPGRPYPHPFTQLKAITDAQILKINAQLVGYSHQLSNITFDSIGQLVPRNGTQAEAVTLDNVCVGPIVDRKGRLYGPFSEAGEFYTTRARVVLEGELELGQEADPPVESARLHSYAAHFVSPQKRVFPLKHIDLHWQNVLLDLDLIVVGIIDWDGAQTVPRESFEPLPFNLSSYIQPRIPQLVAQHERIAWNIFRTLECPGSLKGDISSGAYATQREIAKYLDRYNWAEERHRTYGRMRYLLETLKGI